MPTNKFTKENDKAEISLQKIPVSYKFTCVERRNIYDGILDETEKGIIKHIEEKEKENMLKEIKIAREINDTSKCLDEIAYYKAAEIQTSLKGKLKD